MADDPSSRPTHLEPSKLGTKEYWDNLYTTEITNHSHDPSDKGTVWFDDSDAETKVLEFLEDLTPEGSAETAAATDTDTDADTDPTLPPALDKETTSFLDLGCGNGSLLFALRDEGWRGRCLGVDYSERSVALARQIADSLDKGEQEEEEDDDDDKEEEGAAEAVGFETWDVLRGPYDTVLGGAVGAEGGWDVVHDKGTFDAVSLSEEQDGRGRRLCEGYKGRVLSLVRPGGVFLVTSCNWTEDELEGWFGERSAAVDDEEAAGRFVRVGKVHYPSFSFGGVKGQTISTVCYRRIV